MLKDNQRAVDFLIVYWLLIKQYIPDAEEEQQPFSLLYI